ncbi:MAG: periplasmic heavy metal sensor [Acidobacteriota bacterium]|nr:periplasmic heavy metal sensor [Acidobacteriota bacterium]
MKKFNLYKFLLIGLLSITFFSAANAQEEMPRGDAPAKEFNSPAPRPNLLRELGLTREQMQQIKQLNIGRRPAMMNAQQRQREATRNLDRAIYADSLNETEIAARLKELQSAQAEIAKLRSLNELEVRKILTPEQLVKFREVRQRFAEMRENFENRPNNRRNDRNRNAPNRRFNRQLRKIPND